jgi:hypothetical protein
MAVQARSRIAVATTRDLDLRSAWKPGIVISSDYSSYWLTDTF